MATPTRALALCALAALAPACSDDAAVPAADAAADAPAASAASCSYTNAFSMSAECRDYVDPRWTDALIAADCATARGTLRPGVACDVAASLGTCDIRIPNVRGTRLTFPGDDAARCASTRTGCTVFARGTFTPSALCAAAVGDAGAPADASTSAFPVFQPAVRECRDPLPGQRPGAGDRGQVCTWSAVSGATEEGRRFDDYASCDRVRTQRPYYPRPASPPRADAAARLRDPAYAAELAWVRSQVEASACVCCHAARTSPAGASNWSIDAPGNWVDSFFDSGLALGAGWVDSTALGAYPAAQNNGFDRVASGVPSTDPARMTRFFQQELAHRGRTRESFAATPPFGGPIAAQLTFVPAACGPGEGLGADGTLRWTTGPARYLYVLEQGAANPGVPPNLDVPAATRWLVEVPFTAQPFASGVTYGTPPPSATQRVPAAGAPPALSPGATYYLYVLEDVGIPITRCTFAVPR
jgi:hypothetical protein